MRYPLTSALFLPLATLLGTGCLVNPNPQQDPCAPNPCTQGNKNQCVNENGTARCLCNAGFVQRPSGVCEQESAANCPEHTGDTAEPDDCQSRARALASDGAPRLQTIEPIGDYDFFRIDATAGHLYTVVVQPEGSLMPRVDAFDQGGIWLGAHDGRPTAELTFKASSTSPYFVRVSHSPVDPSAATGSYALTYSTLGEEDHGDTPEQGTSVTPDPAGTANPQVHYGRLEYGQDQDWFLFPVTIGHRYRISFDTSRAVPTLAAYTESSPQQPFLTTRQSVVDILAESNTTVGIALYSPEGQASSYAFSILAF